MRQGQETDTEVMTMEDTGDGQLQAKEKTGGANPADILLHSG